MVNKFQIIGNVYSFMLIQTHVKAVINISLCICYLKHVPPQGIEPMSSRNAALTLPTAPRTTTQSKLQVQTTDNCKSAV